MKCIVLFFGALSDVTGHAKITIENTGDTNTLKQALEARFPAMKKHTFLIAVNQDVVHGNITLHEGDEIALLPPYAGG